VRPRPGAERKARENAQDLCPSSGVSAFVRSSLSGLEGLCVEPRVQRKGKIMALYEHVYLARQDISSQQVEALSEQFKTIIEHHGGKVEKVEYWGVKSIAYRIKKNRKAHFTLLNIDAPANAIAEMERQMGINEDVIRFLTVRVEELEAGPSAMMRKRDDDDRERGDRERGDRNRGRFDRGDRGPRRGRDDVSPNEEGGF
jgi:small subunit ribosomal protein S6